MRNSLLVLVILLVIVPSRVWASAAIQRRAQQQKEMQARMIAQQQAEIQKQMIAQQQAQYQQAAYQKAAQEYAAYKQAMEMAVARRNAELQAARQVKERVAQQQAQQIARYQQAKAYQEVSRVVQYKQAEEARAVVAAKQQAELNGQVREYADFISRRKQLRVQDAVEVAKAVEAKNIMEYNAYQKARAAKARAEVQAKLQYQEARRRMGREMAEEVMASSGPAVETPQAPQEETTVSMKELWAALDENSEPWQQILDDEIKLLTVAEYIDRFQKMGIRVKNSPGHYARLIDALAVQIPGFLSTTFRDVLSYAAIMEYDFENGQDKDALARQVLGEQNYLANKKRFSGK